MDQRGRCRLVFSVFSFFQFFVSGGYEELVNKWSTHIQGRAKAFACNVVERSSRKRFIRSQYNSCLSNHGN